MTGVHSIAVSLSFIAAAIFSASSPAKTINLPPVVVTELVHQHYYDKFLPATITADMVTFPCAIDECSGPGFSASIGFGDTVITRIEAPPGYKFVITLPPDGSVYFVSDPFWHTGVSDTISDADEPTITFENLIGLAPFADYSLNAVSDNGEAVETDNDFVVVGDCEFTALVVQFTVDHALADILRNYGPVNSYQVPSFGCARVGFNQVFPDATLMQILPIAPKAAVEVPEVIISELQHAHFTMGMMNPQTITRDTVTFPCTGGICNGPGFSVSIGTGDTIVTRVAAPAGYKFVVTRAPGGNQTFFSRPYWQTLNSDAASNFATPIISFENLAGTAPTSTYNLNFVSDNGEVVETWNDFSVTGDFEFTAMVVVFTVAHPVADILRSYGNVRSSSVPSFGSSHVIPGMAPDVTLMQIVPIGQPCPADITSPPNNTVDVFDLFVVLGNWGTNGAGADLAEPTNTVDVFDLFVLLSAWGDC